MLPISDYALVGDCHGAALVGREGSIGWCCFKRFDGEPALFGILDRSLGGEFTIAPAPGSGPAVRAYQRGTNILETVFSASAGRVTVTDFMPVGRAETAGVHDYVSLIAPHALIRVVTGMEGSVRMRAAYRPAAGFGSKREGAAPVITSDLPLRRNGEAMTTEFMLGPGERHVFALSAEQPLAPAACFDLLGVTDAFWREWIAYCRYRGPYRGTVERSALALKLLTYTPTGAIVAAPTTSLPEAIGGERNWDYRYCWLRDSCLMLYALSLLGYSGEAAAFSRFSVRICDRAPRPVQIMYGIEGEEELTERELEHLAGYRGSKPVRIGNGAFSQRQTDVYGEVADWITLDVALGARLDACRRDLLERMASLAIEHSGDAEHGIWEMRGPPRHFVLGKIMCWVALDRALRLLGANGKWRAAREVLRAEVLRLGVRDGHLVQAYGAPHMDAALLLVPLLGFPLDRDCLARTVAALESELRQGDFLLRYRTEDGLSGGEGAFLACSFWLVDALLVLDRYPEAVNLFERLIARANDVGLLPEQADPERGEFLGNFPQALTHLALVSSAVHLELYEQGGAPLLAGTFADRSRRAVGATFGWRAIVEVIKRSRRVGRLRSSSASKLSAATLGRQPAGAGGR